MGSRLELKHGLVAEADRLSTSADTMLAVEPATGSKARTKGNMYLLVSAGRLGGRAREATALIADTIRREYYYDESAGVPICLEKAVRSANRKLRGSRDGNAIPAGSLGIALAIVRGGELYVATIGDADAYLVRAARLLMPDHSAIRGLPADDGLRLDVWRGELAVGDSLLLVSRNMTEVVGTEELKNAVVTLHPQSAVEHLHHLFVAAGGDGSDAVLAVEATELVLARGDRRLVPAGGAGDAYGELPAGPFPSGQQVAGAASAVSGAFGGAASAVTGAFGGAVDRVMDLMPRRVPSPRGVTPLVSRRESQRRAALALLALLGVVLVLGVLVWVFPKGQDAAPPNLPAGEQALVNARSKAEEASRSVGGDPTRAVELYRQAWAEIRTAEAAGVAAAVTDPIETEIRTRLDGLHRSYHLKADTLATFQGANPIAVTRGPDRAVYVADGDDRSILRIPEKKGGEAKRVVRAGDGPPGSEGIGAPRLLTRGGVDVVIVDGRGQLWRWRASGTSGRGNLGRPKVSGGAWGNSPTDVTTLLFNASDNLYNLYVTDPTDNQIHKYQPQFGSEAYSAPSSYLTTDTEDVASYIDTYIDGDLYTLTADNVVKHEAGIRRDYALQTPPDDADLRPGHEYLFLDGLGEDDAGRLFVYDTKWSRILVFDKATGEYREQYSTAGRQPRMSDVRGFYVYQPPAKGSKPVVVWVTASGSYSAPLQDAPSTLVDAAAGPGAAPEATRRPRPRTPKP